jgi:hypothetical protein
LPDQGAGDGRAHVEQTFFDAGFVLANDLPCFLFVSVFVHDRSLLRRT